MRLSLTTTESPQNIELLPWAEAQFVTGIIIRAEVEPEQRRELMQMCKGWLANHQLQPGCLERRVYEDATLPTRLLLVEEWLGDKDALRTYLSSEGFRALVGALKVLGTFVDIRTFETTLIESG